MVGLRSLGVLLSVVRLASAAPRGFQEWAREYEKHYDTEDETRKAKGIFMENLEVVRLLHEQEDGSAEYRLTRFGDVSPADFKRTWMPRTMDAAEGQRGGSLPDFDGLPAEPPASADWRAQGAVTPVKDQASCGSCWAESAVANIESVWYLANKGTVKAPVSLSVEQVIECDPHDNACYGGYPKGAYQYTIEHGGLASDTDYAYRVAGHVICLANQTFNETCGDGMCSDPPLTSFCDLRCSDSTHKSVAQISSWVALPRNEDQMAIYLAAHGPISVGIDASGGSLGVLFPWLQFYHRGIANPRRCTSKIDHGVLAVGYGTEDGKKYWLIKNSWGGKWGEQGYFRLIRGDAKCGITDLASSAVSHSLLDFEVVV